VGDYATGAVGIGALVAAALAVVSVTVGARGFLKAGA
jgi:hypothetical protein